MLEEPNFKVYTDFDTPSGDASLLRDQENPEGSVLNSTEISSLGDPARPEPNLSAITTTQTPNTNADMTGNPSGITTQVQARHSASADGRK